MLTPALARAGGYQARLLADLHDVYDKSAFPVLAFRVGGDGTGWSIAGDLLTITRASHPAATFGLQGRTLRDLRDAILAAGLELTFQAGSDVLELAATILLEGGSAFDATNGDHLEGYTNILWVWTDVVARWLGQTKADIELMLRQLVIGQSGDWAADYWGSFFGVLRRPGEDDVPYTGRIVWEPRRPRNNARAIGSNISRNLGLDITVREPWRQMAIASGSHLSTPDCVLPLEGQYAYHYIQLVARQSVDFALVMLEADPDRPAGTLWIPPTVELQLGVQNPEPTLGFSYSPLYSIGIHRLDGAILSVNAILDGMYYLFNPSIAYATYSDDGLVADVPAPPLATIHQVATGEVVLSVGPALGTQQAHFGGRKLVVDGAPARSSVARLSDYRFGLHYEPILRWDIVRTQFGMDGFTVALGPIGQGERLSLGVDTSGTDHTTGLGRVDLRALDFPDFWLSSWTGFWDGRTWGSSTYPLPQLGCRYALRLDTAGLASTLQLGVPTLTRS